MYVTDSLQVENDNCFEWTTKLLCQRSQVDIHNIKHAK